MKSDVGTWTLSAANTYTGTTTVSGGTLVVGIDSVNTNLVLTSGALGRSALVMTGSGLVDLNGFDLAIASLEGQAGNLVSMGAQTLTVGFDGTDTTFTGSITGTDGSLTKVGTGSLTLAGQNSHTGPTSVQGGTLRAGVAGQAFGLNSAVIVGAAGNLDLNGFSQTIGSLASLGGVKLGTGTLTLGTDNTNTTYNGVMSGSGAAALVKVGTGTQTMNGEHTFTGSVSINAGALRIQNGQSLGTGTTGKLTVASGAALELEGGFTTAYAYGASIAGAGVSEGGAIRHVSGANNYTGIITLADDARINSDSGTLTLSGDVDVGANTLTLGGAGAMMVSGNLGAGAGALVKDGAGVTTFTGEVLSTGGLTVSQGTLAIDYTAGSNRVATANTLTLHDGATLRFDNLQANNQTFAGVTLTGTGSSRLVLGTNRTTGVVDLTTVANPTGIAAMDVSNMLSDPATSWLRISGLPSVLNLTAAYGITGNNGVDVLATDVNGMVYLAQTMDYSRGGAIADSASAVRLIESGLGTNIPGQAITLAASTVDVPTILNAYTVNSATPDTTITLAIGSGNLLRLAKEGAVTSTAGTNLAITGGTLTSNATAADAGLIAFNSGSDANGNGGAITVSSVIADNGAGNVVALSKIGEGTLILTATNTYSGTTTVNQGTLIVTGNNAPATGLITVNQQGTLQVGDGTQFGFINAGDITNNGILAANNGGSFTMANNIVGTGGFRQLGGVTTLTGTNTFTGLTEVKGGTLALSGGNALADTAAVQVDAAGTLQLNSSETIGSLAGDAGSAVNLQAHALTFGDATDTTFAGVISGTGDLTKNGAGTVTLTGENNLVGTMTISAGTIAVGDGSTTGSLGVGAVVNNATLSMNRSDNHTVSNVISGTGTLEQNGTGVLTLSGSGSSVAALAVNSGTVNLTGSLTGATTTVAYGATLTGSGSTTGAVAIADGGLLTSTPGQVLATGALSLSNASQVNVTLGAPSNDALFKVDGNLVLDGALNITDGGSFGLGVYRIFDYTGALTDNGMTFGILPVNVSASTLSIQTSQVGQVNLVNIVGAQFVFWDGSNTTGTGTVDGGTGTWTTTGTNWTDSTGAVNGVFETTPQPGFAIFQGTAGTVTVSNSPAEVKASGMQFSVDGYTVTGGPLTLVNDASATNAATIRVGDATQAGAAMTATIAAVLQDDDAVATNLVKSDYGTLVLSGNNTYTGTTAVSVGTLQIGAGGTAGTLGAGATSVASGATLAYNRSDAVLFDRVITGDGVFSQIGAGVLTVTGANTYTGGTTIGTNSEISLNATGALGTGAVANDGTLSFASSTAKTFANSVSGTGDLDVLGAGPVTLSGASTYTGATQVNTGSSLVVTGSLGNTATNIDGTLSGSGSIAGEVTVSSTGRLLGVSGQTLTTGGIDFASGASILDVTLPTTGTGPLFVANGDVTMDGVVNITTTSGIGYGVYRVINYTGALTDNDAVIGTVAGGPAATEFSVQTSETGWVNIVRADSSGGITSGHSFWNGAGVANSGVIVGGTGTWSATETNWTTVDGLDSGVQSSGFLVFQGTGGAVTLAGIAGGAGREITGMQFAVDGYTFSGGSLMLTADSNGDTVLRVGAGVNATTVATLDTVLTGSTNLRKTDAGTLVLTRSNYFTGSTFVDAGVLQLGDGGSSGNLNGRDVTVAQSATLAFDRADRMVFGSDILGAGTVVQRGSGTVVLTADSARTGLTRVESGVLQVGDSATGGVSGSLGSGDVTVLSGASLTFDRVDAHAVANRIGGAGALVVMNGAVTLAGDNTYTGMTTVRSGSALRLASNSSTGDVVVDAGGLFGGTGTVRGSLLNKGFVSPGFSPGTLNVSGNFTQGASGVLQVELASSSSFDRVTVTGTASLDGKVQLINGGYTANSSDTFQILTAAGGVTGTLTLDAPLYVAAGMQVAVNANDVVLYFTPPSPTPSPVVIPGLTPNQTETAGAIVDLIGNGNASDLTAAVAGTPSAALPTVLNNLSPQGIDRWWENLRHNTVAIVRSNEVRMDRLGDLQNRGSEIWAHTTQRESSFSGNPDEQHARGSASSITVGADAKPGDNYLLGALVQYGNERVYSSMRTEISHFSGAVYGRYYLPISIPNVRVFLDGTAGVGYGDYDTKRQVNVPGYSRTAVSDTHAKDVFSTVRLGVETKFKNIGIMPYVAASHTRYWVTGFEERDAGQASLKVSDVSAESLAMRLGFALDTSFKISGIVVTPQLNMAWRHEYRDNGMDISSQMAGTDWTVRGNGARKDGLEAAVSLNLGLNEHWNVYGSIGAYVDGNAGASQNYQAGVSYKF